MYNIIRIPLIAASILVLCACSPKSSIDYIDKSYETDTISVNLQVPQLKDLGDKDFTRSLNLEIEDACTEVLNKFKDSAKNLSIPAVFTAETKNYETKGFISLVTQIDYYTKSLITTVSALPETLILQTANVFLLRIFLRMMRILTF